MKKFPAAPGVYIMKDAEGRVLYVGKSVSIRNRVLSYLRGGEAARPNINVMMEKLADVDFIETPSEVDALLAEQRLIRDMRPKYNVDLKDDKSYPCIEIRGREDFPQVLVTRNPHSGSKVYGPFTDAEGLRAAYALLQRIFKFRVCSLDIREGDPKNARRRPCLYYYIKSCLAPCAGRVTKEEYRASIKGFRQFLEGRRARVVRGLEKEMAAAAEHLEFEKAAEIRDRLRAIQSLSKRGLFGDYAHVGALEVDPRKALGELARRLGLDEPPRLIEGVDIATIGGSDSVGSVVTFVDGKPFKKGYRKYKIKKVKGTDDYASIREVVYRRYRRLVAEGGFLPDFLLVDGGPGQLSAALEGLERAGARPRKVASLAKREELVFLEGRGEPVELPRTSAALKVLQFVRDEAHRFAQSYHHTLRSKRFFGKESVKVGKLARAGRQTKRRAKTE
ncbi:MAG: excinuclease ABC subunit UvrC [Planctomycetes bacterium]|nr:excinuclease ABC subunit UvrC [Planctomycetota bacterium]